ncbi:glycosyltransferase family 4 protein [Mesorhizobium sp. VNQ89]|uniref:glycosyltransferase family 4 protein n=1 Tax=Mesorhizobium quangtriensis TaxID=3157709 RepID=UPI0032B74BA1
MGSHFNWPKKILVHDYSGHAFTAQLARELARQGRQVCYVSFAGFSSPKGKVSGSQADPDNFKAVELNIDVPLNKENLIKRAWQQQQYKRKLDRLIREERPDAIISANAPLEVQRAVSRYCVANGASFLFWFQDVHSEAIERILSKRSRLLGMAAGWFYRRMEIRTLRRSAAIVAITEAFRDLIIRWRIDSAHVEVIQNWAAINDIPLRPRDNEWVRQNMPGDRLRIVYSGTLARKHNPDVVLHLARAVDADIYVFSEGAAPDQIRQMAASEGLHNVFVRSWVPIDQFPDMLAGADILFAMIEKDASAFSVPSKILSYLAAGRPILASIPAENLACQTIKSAQAGLVSAPDDIHGLIFQAQTLLADDALRSRFSENGRKHAEEWFDVETIAQRFLKVLQSSRAPRT